MYEFFFHAYRYHYVGKAISACWGSIFYISFRMGFFSSLLFVRTSEMGWAYQWSYTGLVCLKWHFSCRQRRKKQQSTCTVCPCGLYLWKYCRIHAHRDDTFEPLISGRMNWIFQMADRKLFECCSVLYVSTPCSVEIVSGPCRPIGLLDDFKCWQNHFYGRAVPFSSLLLVGNMNKNSFFESTLNNHISLQA